MRPLALLALLGVGLTAATAHAQTPQKQPGKKRPNVLIVVADDWSWPHAGVYGDKVVKTPHFDRAAKRGMLFHRSHCVSPSCTPSRAAILTGQTIHRLKQGGNLHGILPQEFDVFPDLLERSGYVLGLVGKGWGPGVLEGSGRTRNPAGPPAKNFAAFLKALPPDRPFYFWYGSRDPHRPYEEGIGVKAGMKTKDVTVPPYWPDTEKVRGDVLDYYARVQRFDDQLGELLELLEKSGRAENTIVIIISDNGMPFPRCKANLYDCGTHMPMAVVWPDRLKAGGDCHDFVNFIDLAPTILEAAGVPVPKAMHGHSLLPLLTGDPNWKGQDRVFVERERHANVRKGDLSYPVRAIRTKDFLYVRNLRPDRWPAGDPELYFAVGPFGDIDDGPCKREVMRLELDATFLGQQIFKRSCGKRPAEELYDLKKDPHEMDNVANQAEYAKIKAALRADLDRWMKETGDPRSGPGGGDDIWDRYKYYGKPEKKQKAGLRRELPGETPRAGSVSDGLRWPSLTLPARTGVVHLPESLSRAPDHLGAD
jgi:arylsulfatase A-like enzyme